MELLWCNKQGSSSASESSPIREVSPVDGVIEDMQSRIRRLERWHTINTVLPIPFAPKVVPELHIYPSGFCRYCGHFWCLHWLVIRSTKGSVSDVMMPLACRLVFTLRAEFFLNLVAVSYHFYTSLFPPVLIIYCIYREFDEQLPNYSCFLIWTNHRWYTQLTANSLSWGVLLLRMKNYRPSLVILKYFYWPGAGNIHIKNK